ncbi:MAG: molybdopterin molybdotransferase MoeA [Desulfamplus sp.]|nr:molybdopterin molybdotransferase MoeA [Desulfamplus sp.]
MNHFFRVKTLEQVMTLVPIFPTVGIETVHISKAYFRVLATDINADQDIPGFRRATMDGYAVHSGSTFGASESNPAWLTVTGSILMGDVPEFSIQSGQAAKISTGGMLPDGADSVVMVEHTESVNSGSVKNSETVEHSGKGENCGIVEDNGTVEIYKSVPPLQNMIDKDEDFKKGEKILKAGTLLRPQEIGLAAALGICELPVYKIPKVGIISTGDEIVPIDKTPSMGKIRDINSHTLAGLIIEAGAEPIQYGIIKDNEQALFDMCKKALYETDMVLISGGSSVGTRDFTVNVLSSLKDTEILVHGISISPGKPTILGKSFLAQDSSFNTTLVKNELISESGIKPIWGLPGHVVSAMVVFKVVVAPFLNKIRGLAICSDDFEAENRGTKSKAASSLENIKIPATLTRNVASAQGRTDFIRVKLFRKFDVTSNNKSEKKSISKDGCLKYKYELFAEPILGKSGLIRTMVMADGLLEIGENVEGLEKGELVYIIPLRAFL